MAKSRHSEGTDALDDIESWGERAGEWLENNARRVFVAAMLLLAVFGGYGAWDSWRENREVDASDALDKTRTEFLQAMGGDPLSVQEPELANPAIAEELRREYAERFREIADEHRGTVGGALARLEEGTLRKQAGDPELSLEVLQALLQDVPNGALRGVVQERIAAALEDAGRWADAAQAHEAAADIEAYELRHWALAAAARCWAEAGDDARASELALRVHAEAPDLKLAPHVANQLEELRAATTP